MPFVERPEQRRVQAEREDGLGQDAVADVVVKLEGVEPLAVGVAVRLDLAQGGEVVECGALAVDAVVVAQSAGDDLPAGQVAEVAHVVVGQQRCGVAGAGQLGQPVDVGGGRRQRLDGRAPPRADEEAQVPLQRVVALQALVGDGGALGGVGDGPHRVLQRAVDEPQLAGEVGGGAGVEFAVEQCAHEPGVFGVVVGGCGGFPEPGGQAFGGRLEHVAPPCWSLSGGRCRVVASVGRCFTTPPSRVVRRARAR